MKRKTICRDVEQQKTKKQKSTRALIDLPGEIIFKCLANLSKNDIIFLSNTDKAHRAFLSKVIFQSVKCKWQDLINCDKAYEFMVYVEKVRLIDSYSYGEWQIDIFKLLHTYMPNATSLYINSTNSTSWMKYRSSAVLREIGLYYERGYDIERSTVLEDPKKTFHEVKMKSPKIFNSMNLRGFSVLQTIHIDGYHFNWSVKESPNTLQLSKVILSNCTWEYPFDPIQFNIEDSVKSFSISYTCCHPFLLSERFNKFLHKPFRHHSKSIEKLSISFHGFEATYLKYLSPKLLSYILGEDFCKLQNLSLHGWLFEPLALKPLISLMGMNRLRYFEIYFLSAKWLVEESYIPLKKLMRDVRKRFPWLKAKLEVIAL